MTDAPDRSPMEPVRLAQVGVGYWGRNMLRALRALPEADVRWACDRRPDARAAADAPGLQTAEHLEEALRDDAVEAVVVATETPAHYETARMALQAGKHVFVEKPLAQTAEEAAELVHLAEDRDRVLMVGHLLLHHPAYRDVLGRVARGELGDVRYVYSVRVNLGIVRETESAFDSLAPHDLAVALALTGSQPVSVACQGQAFLRPGVDDVAFAVVRFENGALAHLHTSWLDPHKVRRTTVVGSRKMAVVDDMEAAEKVRLYDKGADVTPGTPTTDDGYASFAEAVAVRSGDIVIPRVPSAEPLRLEMLDFVQAVRHGRPSRTDGRQGLAVVQLLDAARRSARSGGSPVDLPR